MQTLENQADAWDAAMHPGTITIAGINYTGSMLIRSGELVNQDGGQRIGDVLTFWLWKGYSGLAQPAENSRVTCNGVTWIIQTIDGKEPHAREWKLTCTKA
jgi:hypothetical protein